MSSTIIASWEDLRNLVQAAESDCSIFTPYYSSLGLKVVESSLKRRVGFSFWTKLSLRDWATGVSDPLALSSMLGRMEKAKLKPLLFTSKQLHAKAYFADAIHALLGSANLTNGGFNSNIEVMVRLSGEDALSALNMLSNACSSRSIAFSLDELNDWINRHKGLVKKFAKRVQESNSEIDSAQLESDTELGLKG